MKPIKVAVVANTPVNVTYEKGRVVLEYVPFEDNRLEAENVEPKTPTPEEVRKRYPVGTRVKGFGGGITEVAGIEPIFRSHGYYIGVNELTNGTSLVLVWSEAKGWTEIIEPVYTNRFGTEFHVGDAIYWVDKSVNIVRSSKIPHAFVGVDVLSEGKNDTEVMTKEQAEQYVLDHRVFEECCFYNCVFQGEVTVCDYSINEGFQVIGSEIYLDRSDFDSIGEKITF